MNALSNNIQQAQVARRISNSIAPMWQDGDVRELRILGSGRGVISGYYDSIEALSWDASLWSGHCTGVYFTINPVNPDLLARAKNRLREYTRANETTCDADIIRRRHLPIDLDPIRPAGVSATHHEHCEALGLAGRIADFLSDMGFTQPFDVDSGNGAYLIYPCDLPNDEESRRYVKRSLEALARKFDTGTAKVDTGTFNASRILRVPGTMNCKGDPTEERPHRLCILCTWPGMVL